jgi:hypothetical protein
MAVSLQEIITDEQSFGVFLLVSVAMGGGAAWLTGRAIAATWRPWWHIALYMLLLASAVRFLHFALFDAAFLSLHYYAVDYTVCLIFGLVGFRLMRVSQMVSRYRWINQRAGIWRWRRRDETRVHTT